MKVCTTSSMLSIFILSTSIPGFASALGKNDPEVDRLIKHYWSQHKTYAVILSYLRIIHGVSVGMTWLKNRLKKLELFKRGSKVRYTPLSSVKAAIQNTMQEYFQHAVLLAHLCEMKGPNCNLGYRQMWRVIQEKYHYVTKRSTVMMLMRILDPDAVDRRCKHRLKRRVYQNKGPNFVWHLDGYDKLKPYGFAVHGCIDGFSRKVIWLKVASTNNNPMVILLYYLTSILSCKGIPSIVRSDCGTENSCLAACHMMLRHSHGDEFRGEKSYRYGSSTTNTRIEGWWAQLRKFVTDYWMNIFKDMITNGEFNPNLPLHKHCLAYVYEHLIESSLNNFKDRWNKHKIRKNRLAGCPAGVPDDLYNLPQIHGTEDYRKPLDFDGWVYCYENYCCKPQPYYPIEFDAAATAILSTMNMEKCDIDEKSAKLVYLHLVNSFSNN